MLNITDLKAGLGRMTGHTDVAEAYFGGGLYIAAKDGTVDRDEVMAVKNGAKASDFLLQLFNADDLDRIWDKTTAGLKGQADFRAACLKEVRDIAGEPEIKRQGVFIAMVQTANATDGVDPDEMEGLHEVADALNLSVTDRDEIIATVVDKAVKIEW